MRALCKVQPRDRPTDNDLERLRTTPAFSSRGRPRPAKRHTPGTLAHVEELPERGCEVGLGLENVRRHDSMIYIMHAGFGRLYL